MIALPPNPTLADLQRYIHDLEALHGWLDVDLIHNCFLMGEEIGELFKAVRKYERYFDQSEEKPGDEAERKAGVAEELVDVLNYTLAIANRLDLDLETAFRAKNQRNEKRHWEPAQPSDSPESAT